MAPANADCSWGTPKAAPKKARKRKGAQTEFVPLAQFDSLGFESGGNRDGFGPVSLRRSGWLGTQGDDAKNERGGREEGQCERCQVMLHGVAVLPFRARRLLAMG